MPWTMGCAGAKLPLGSKSRAVASCGGIPVKHPITDPMPREIDCDDVHSLPIRFSALRCGTERVVGPARASNANLAIAGVPNHMQ